MYDKKEEKTRDPNLGSVSMSWSHCTHCGKTQLFVHKLVFDVNISKTICLHFVNEFQLFIYIFSSNFCCLFTFSAVCLHFGHSYKEKKIHFWEFLNRIVFCHSVAVASRISAASASHGLGGYRFLS